jgi:hypothetical protein
MPPRLPNAENLASKWARTDPTVLASQLGDRTFTVLPKTYTGPWPAARVTRIGGAPDESALLDEPILQWDVWGGSKDIAHDVAALLVEGLASRLPFRGTGGALLAVIRFGGLRYLPDTTEDPARPRYTLDVTVRTRA